LLASSKDLGRQTVVLNGLAEGMGRRGRRLEDFLAKMEESPEGKIGAWFAGVLRTTAKQVADPKTPPGDRLAGIRLLGQGSWKQARGTLAGFLKENEAPEVRLAAARALAEHGQAEVSELLLEPWQSYAPALRREILEAILSRPGGIAFLFDKIEAKEIQARDLDVGRSRQLLGHPDPTLRDRARKLLAGNLPADRKEVLARYQSALVLKADAKRGQEVFRKNCATCHRVKGIGIDVAPDISDTRTKTLEALLVDIINPNQAIDNNYVSYLVTTKSGKSLTGVISAETASSITLKRAEGQQDVVLRQDIEAIQSSGVSLMPEGLEKSISVAEMADLLSFLKNWRYLDGGVPVGR
jgi:putative heme-binding domain-containing protein